MGTTTFPTFPPTNEIEIYETRDVAKASGLSTQTVLAWVRSGMLRAHRHRAKCGSEVLFRPLDLAIACMLAGFKQGGVQYARLQECSNLLYDQRWMTEPV